MQKTYYKIVHTKEEINKIYELSDQKETQNKLMSLLSYYKKHSDDGVLKYSLNKLYKMYIRYHKAMAKSYFYKLMGWLKEAFFTQAEERNEEIFEEIQKPPTSIENTSLESNSENPNNITTNNKLYNTNTIEIIKSFYKGISGRKVATKKDLLDIAKSLMKANNITITEVQTKVFSKIHNSKRRIDLAGAVAYINTIIIDKLSDYDSKNFITSLA